MIHTPKLEVNNWISGYASKRGIKKEKKEKESEELGKMILFDMFKEISYSQMKEGERKKFWCDGLHLTPDGYDRMGASIAKLIIANIDF